MRGQESPQFFPGNMILEADIKKLVEEKILGTGRFLVDVKVLPGNKIEVLLDAPERISINDCVEVSRHVEKNLDREKEDFELMVSSSGLDEPFKVFPQYLKNKSKEVSVLKRTGEKLEGILADCNESKVVLEITRKIKKENGKGNQLIKETVEVPMEQIKETKLIISFK